MIYVALLMVGAIFGFMLFCLVSVGSDVPQISALDRKVLKEKLEENMGRENARHYYPWLYR